MSLSVRLHGDRTKARSMAEAHVNRLIREFRNLNAFQGLQQNARRIDLYDGENLAGHILLKTVFGTETVEVYAMPPKPQPVPKIPMPVQKICPVLPGKKDGGYGGSFVFLDGIFSSSVVFIPHEVSFSEVPVINTGNMTSLSLVEKYERPEMYAHYVVTEEPSTGFYDNGKGHMTAALYDGGYTRTPLEGFPEGTWQEPSIFTDVGIAFGTHAYQSFMGAVWSSSAWCGVSLIASRSGLGTPVTYRYDAFLNGEVVNVVPETESTGDLYNIHNGLVGAYDVGPGPRRNYKDSADRMYVIGFSENPYIIEPHVALFTPQVTQWLSVEDVSQLAEVDGFRPYPQTSLFDWVLVKEV